MKPIKPPPSRPSRPARSTRASETQKASSTEPITDAETPVFYKAQFETIGATSQKASAVDWEVVSLILQNVPISGISEPAKEMLEKALGFRTLDPYGPIRDTVFAFLDRVIVKMEIDRGWTKGAIWGASGLIQTLWAESMPNWRSPFGKKWRKKLKRAPTGHREPFEYTDPGQDPDR